MERNSFCADCRNAKTGVDKSNATVLRYGHSKRNATVPKAKANRRKASKKGEVNMTTPNTGELLVKEARDAERLRLLLLANECKTIEEFRQRLQELTNRQ